MLHSRAIPAPETMPPVALGRGVRDLRGQRFGMLEVVSFAGTKNKNAQWACRCDCGERTIVSKPNLERGGSTSCGCVRANAVRMRRVTHGQTRERKIPREFVTWCNLRNRCYNPKNNRYAIYGSRGIRVCDRWLVGADGVSAFACFLSDMGPKPSPSHSIDRIDVNGNYEPANCRWATASEQARNKRKAVRQ